jgi:hypothetical protein
MFAGAAKENSKPMASSDFDLLAQLTNEIREAQADYTKSNGIIRRPSTVENISYNADGCGYGPTTLVTNYGYDRDHGGGGGHEDEEEDDERCAVVRRLTVAYSLLCTLVAYDRRNASYIIVGGLHEDALQLLRSSPEDPSQWIRGNNSPQAWCTYFLTLCAATTIDSTASIIKAAGAMDVLVPMIHHDSLMSALATMALALTAVHTAEVGYKHQEYCDHGSRKGAKEEQVRASGGAAVLLKENHEDEERRTKENGAYVQH